MIIAYINNTCLHTADNNGENNITLKKYGPHKKHASNINNSYSNYRSSGVVKLITITIP
jgi:hypothetical protein